MGEIVRRTLDYVLRELRDFQGGFYCGQDADSEGEEGKYYVFTAGELRDRWDGGRRGVLRLARRHRDGELLGKNILNLIGREQVQREPVRIRPLRRGCMPTAWNGPASTGTTKVLAAWNGLMIAALARAGLALDEPRYRDAAVEPRHF